MDDKSSRTGRPSRSSLLILTTVVLIAAVGFLLSDPDDVRESEGAAYGTCGDDLTWTIDSEGNLKIEGSGPMTDYEYGEIRWGGNKVTSVVIGDSVASIGEYAFSGCTSLTSVTIPDSVTSIGKYAFSGCTSLDSVTIPDSVTSIGISAFSSCTSLTAIEVDSSNTEYTSEDGVLYNKSKTELLQYPAGKTDSSFSIPDSVTFIRVNAFSYCISLTSVTIGNSVTSIEWGAFYNCTSLASVTIGNSVTSIGEYAFYNCTSLESVTIPSSVTSIEYCAFTGCTSLASVTIPDSVTSIGVDAFSYCTSLTSIIIPDSVTSIGGSAFFHCTSLASLTVPDSVTYIGPGAFSGCTSLISVTIPDSVAYIGEDAFEGCTSLTAIVVDSSNAKYASEDGVLYNKSKTELLQYPASKTDSSFSMPDSVTSIRGSAFSGCTSLTSVTIPDSVTFIGISAFSGCTSLASLTIPDSVTYIGSDAFYNCTSLASVTIGNSVTSIGEYAFYNCTSLTALVVDSSNTQYTSEDGVLYNKNKTELLQYPAGKPDSSFSIPDSVTSIRVSAFSYCTSLASIIIPDSVTSIGGRAFSYCTSLTSIIIPDSVTFIGSYSFYNCTSLASLTIPNSVTSIGWYAFEGCTSLTALVVDSSNRQYTSEDGVLYNKSKTELLQYPAGKTDSSFSIPDSMTSIRVSAFSYCTSLTSIIIPDSVTFIGGSAFSYCTSLASVTIPNSVTSISDRAFEGCTSLNSIIIPDSVTSIKDWAFSGCTSLTSLTIPNSVISIRYSAFENHVFYDADGVTVLKPTTSNLAGHTFKGETVERMIKQDSGQSTKHSVTYDIDGGTGSAPVSGQYAEGETFVLPTYDGTKDGYIFAGWNHGGSTYAAGQTVTMSSEDMTFVANWVPGKNVTSISLSETNITLVRGEAKSLIATVYPTDATMKDVVWTSADGSVAAVDEDGKVTALGLGRTTITATSADGGISASCIVSVEDRKILVAIKSAGDGNVYVMISSLDGGRVPAGRITMELNYSVYSATLEDWVDRSDSTKDDPVLVETDGTFAVVLIDLSDAEHPADYTSAVAMFTVGEGDNRTVYMSDITGYSGKSS